MSTIYLTAFAAGALVCAVIVISIAAITWPMPEWERTARWRWAGGKVTLAKRITWRLFRPIRVPFELIKGGAK